MKSQVKTFNSQLLFLTKLNLCSLERFIFTDCQHLKDKSQFTLIKVYKSVHSVSHVYDALLACGQIHPSPDSSFITLKLSLLSRRILLQVS